MYDVMLLPIVACIKLKLKLPWPGISPPATPPGASANMSSEESPDVPADKKRFIPLGKTYDRYHHGSG
jgi:hypothetical protein